MTTVIRGAAGVDLEVDENENAQVFQTVPGYPTAGGFYTVAGKTGTAAIAAALATDVSLVSLRFSAVSSRKAYINKIRVQMNVLTAGAAGGVPSVLGIQRFTTATPSGGTTRTAHQLGPSKGSTSDMTDIRDNNAALTVTSVVFGTEVGWTATPVSGVSTAPIEWIFEPLAPVELSAGDGIVLRTRQAGPATATWYFSYNVHWFER